MQMINRIENDEGMDKEVERLGEGEPESKHTQAEIADTLGLKHDASWEDIAKEYHKREHGREKPGSNVNTN